MTPARSGPAPPPEDQLVQLPGAATAEGSEGQAS